MIDIGWLAETGPCKMFKAGQSIPCPGASGAEERAMYILIVGEVDVYAAGAGGSAELIGKLLPGDIFGGRELFANVAENVYAAIADSVVYVLSESSFNELSWAQPEILFEVLRAAYMPMRKPPGAPDKKAGKTASGAAAKPKAAGAKFYDKQKQVAAETDDKAGTAGADADGSGVPEKDAPVSGAATAGDAPQSGSQVSIPAGSGLFPEGHKSYPGITKPEYARLVYPKDYVCPFCKKEFSDFKVFRSKLYEAAPMRYDLRRSYTDFQTEWYDIITCRHCYFSTLHNYYTEPKPLQTIKIEAALTDVRASVLLDFEAERDVDFVFTSHYLAMLCAEGYRQSSKLITSKLWGNLSWLYEDVGDEEMMRAAADKAAATYEAIYADTRLTPVQEQITCMSIAGMQYRAGVDRNLKKFLYTVKTMKSGDQTYVRLAEDFAYNLGGETE